jgi:ethanolamine ammonia-lyase large subunit
MYRAVFRHERVSFPDLKTLLAQASPQRSGDALAGLAAPDQKTRILARMALADVPLVDFLSATFIPYESDDVTRLIHDTHERDAFAPIASMTVGEFREFLLADSTDATMLRRLALGLTPEMVAAVSKLMTNGDLIAIAAKARIVTAFRTTIGLEGRIAARLQPNHPTDDLAAIMAATIDGLAYGTGDAVIGVNPATDNLDNTIAILQVLDTMREKLDMPVQSCVLSHVTTTIAAIERGAPVDLVFQSIAGTQKANEGFGVTLAMLREASDAALALKRGSVGHNVMYFETGQGAALSANAHHGLDQQTAEARAYAVARAFSPLLVNTVVGFIGPEYLYDAKEIIRAGLEDHFCGKLLGLPMGVDVCYTNHAEADQNDMDLLAFALANAGVNFVIAVPGADDIMLNYQSLSFHDIVRLRHVLKLRPAPEFEAWLARMGLLDAQGRLPTEASSAATQFLIAAQRG